MNDEIELLRLYAEEKSEGAFAELVAKYINLVYSAALRQVNGNSHLAEEVAQSVFLDMAHKARSLTHHSSLAAWLFTTTRFIASNSGRTEMRRQAREQKAEVMIEQEPDSAWQELCPVLDEAMHQLSERDREAVLLRFFEGLPLMIIGRRWGVTEGAARMRVERAVEKLRLIFQKRGVGISTLGLAALLANRSVEAAPLTLATRIKSLLHEGPTPVLSNPTPSFWRILIPATAVVLFITVTPFLLESSRPSIETNTGQPSQPQSTTVLGTPPESKAPTSDVSQREVIPAAPFVEITILAADSEEPIPNVLFDVITAAPETWSQTKHSGSRLGIARISYPADTLTLDLCTQTDGFSDTRLVWRPNRGESIPARYTLRLTRPTPIGGTVVDADGAPVEGAAVFFGTEEELRLAKVPESHAFRRFEVQTDAGGRWQINRIAPEMLARSFGGASHHERGLWTSSNFKEHPELIPSLTNGTFTFRLGRGLTVQGMVLDNAGQPIEGAEVAAGGVADSYRRETRTRADGTFLLLNTRPGTNSLSARADGFAPLSVPVDIKDREGPYTLRLDQGKTLRFRVLNPDAKPIPEARVVLEQLFNPPVFKGTQQSVRIQFEYSFLTDSEGRAVWANAPDSLLQFSVSAKGYMVSSGVRIAPSDQENVITLGDGLTIRGTVRDAAGKSIPTYRITSGSPHNSRGGVSPYWGREEAAYFSQPTFKQTFVVPVISGGPHPGYFFKFEADGFRPFISRLVNANERDVTFDVTLEQAEVHKLHVVDSSGVAVPHVPLAFVLERWHVPRTLKRFDYLQLRFATTETDSHGDVPLELDPTLNRLVISCPAGFIDVLKDNLPENGLVRLNPWGNVTGRVLRDERPSADELVLATGPRIFAGTATAFGSILIDAVTAKTDQDGRFSLTNVPPGENIVLVAREWKSPAGEILAVHQGNMQINVENEIPIELTLNLPDSKLAKPSLP